MNDKEKRKMTQQLHDMWVDTARDLLTVAHGASPAQQAKTRLHDSLDIYIRANFPPNKQSYILSHNLKRKQKAVKQHKLKETKRKSNIEKAKRRTQTLRNANRLNQQVQHAVNTRTRQTTIGTELADGSGDMALVPKPIAAQGERQLIEINENEPDNEIPEPSAACAAINVPDIITELDEIRNLYIAPTSKIFKKHEKAAQIRSAKIIDKQVHDIIGSDVPWGRNRLVVKYTLNRLKSDIKSRVIRLSASPPVNTPTMGAKGLCPSVQAPD